MAPGAKVKTNVVANGAGHKVVKPVADASPSASGTATPVGDEGYKGLGRMSRPDKATYDKEQEELRSQIAILQEKMNNVRTKIDAGQSGGPSAERRNELRAQLDELRSEQGNSKNSRTHLINQLKSLNESIAKKIKDLQAAKAKAPFKTTADLDAHIRALEKNVESGNMKLVDEKRALAEISQMKRSRKTVENFQADQDSIDQDRAKVEEIRKQLDDPEAKAVNERFDAIKAELDDIKKEGDESYRNRSKLFDERTEIKTQLDSLFERKRTSATKYREDNDKYYAQVAEDRARRAEKQRAQREEEEAAKKRDTALRLREEAEAPAYQAQIQDCQTIIDFFSGKANASARLSSISSNEPLMQRADIAGVPKLELRQVNADTQGLVAVKKKGEDDDNYFVSGNGKGGKSKKSKRGTKSAQDTNGEAESPAAASTNPNAPLNVPLPMITALLSLSIPPPSSSGDVERTITDIRTKQAWFMANQERVTRENIAKAEANIAKIMGPSAGAADPAPPNGNGEKSAEPAPTPKIGGLESGVSSEKVDEELQDKAAAGELEVEA